MFVVKDFFVNFLKRSKRLVHPFWIIALSLGPSGVEAALNQAIQKVFDYYSVGTIDQVGQLPYGNDCIAKSIYTKYQSDVNPILLLKVQGGKTTDQENTLSAYGKVIKIYNLLNNLNGTNNLADTSKINSTINNEFLSTINNTFSPGNVNDQGGSSVCSYLNDAIKALRDSVTYPTLTGAESSDAWTTLKNLTQVGSRGFSPTLIGAIQSQVSVPDGKITNDGALAVLKSEACWQTIFGQATDTAKAEGSIREQLNFSGKASQDLANQFTEISGKLGDWLQNANDSDIIQFYNYLIPSDPTRLDLLGITSGKVDTPAAPLTLQDCIACLLSGYCTDTQASSLITEMGTICGKIWDLITQTATPDCCLTAAQYATWLNENILDATPRKTLLEVLQTFNQRVDPVNSEFNFGTLLREMAQSANGGSAVDLTTITIPKGKACDKLWEQLGELIPKLKERYDNCSTKIGLLTDSDWATAAQTFETAAANLQTILTQPETHHDDGTEKCNDPTCHICSGAGSCDACAGKRDAPLAALSAFAKQLAEDQPKAQTVKNLSELEMRISEIQTTLEDLSNPTQGQRAAIGPKLAGVSVSTATDAWKRAIENATTIETALGNSPGSFTSPVGTDLDSLITQTATQLSDALGGIITSLNLVKTQSESVSDTSFGGNLKTFVSNASQSVQNTWDALISATTGEVQTSLRAGKASLQTIFSTIQTIAEQYSICCKENVPPFKTFLESAEKLVNGLTTWQTRLNNSSPTLPKITDTGWTNLKAGGTLQEALDEAIQAIVLTGVTPTSAEATSQGTTPCDKIQDYAGRTLTNVEKIPALIESITQLAGKRADAELPQSARDKLPELANAFLGKTFPTISCSDCSHSFDNTHLQSTLNQFPELTNKLVESLQPKCCMAEAEALYELAKATDAFEQMTSSLNADGFYRVRNNYARLKEVTNAATNLTLSLPSSFPVHEQETVNGIAQLTTNVDTFSAAWQKTCGGTLSASSLESPEFFNCNSKRNMLKQLNTSINALAETFNELNTGLAAKKNLTSTGSLISFLQAFEGAIQTLKKALPDGNSACGFCTELSVNVILGAPLQSVENALSAILATLGNHDACKELADTTLSFLTAAIQSTNHIIAHIGSEQRKDLLDDLLGTLEAISKVDLSAQKDSVLTDFTEALKSTLTGGTPVPPYTYESGGIFKKETYHETLETMMTELTQNFATLEKALQTILQSWDTDPPTYDAAIHGKLIQLVEYTTDLRGSRALFWEDLAPFTTCEDFTIPNSEALVFDEAFTALNVEALLYAYAHVQDQPALARAVSFVGPLEALRHAVTVCVERPIYTIPVRLGTENPTVNLLQTTRLTPVLSEWQSALETTDETRATQIKALATEIERFYTEELGGTFPALEDSRQPLNRLTEVRVLLTEHIGAIGRQLLGWIDATLAQPIAVQRGLADILSATVSFLSAQANDLIEQQATEQTALLNTPHRAELPEEVEALSPMITALQSFIPSLTDKAPAFLTARCGEPFERAVETLYRRLEKVCEDLSTLAGIMATAPPEAASDPQALSNQTAQLGTAVCTFIEKLVPLPTDLLCAEERGEVELRPVLAAANDLIEPLHAVAESLGLSSHLAPYNETLKGLPVEASLQGIQRLCQELPATVGDLITYAQETYDHAYVEATVTAIQTIAKTLDTTQKKLEQFSQTGIVLCNKRTETPLMLEGLSRGLKESASKMEEFYNTLRLRFWWEHKDPIRTFREQVEQHLLFLEWVQTHLTSDNGALEGGRANANYWRLDRAFQGLNEAFKGMASVSGTLEGIEAFCQTLPYATSLQGIFTAVQDVFFEDVDVDTTTAIHSEETNPLKAIQEDLVAILTALDNQATALRTIDEFPIGGGNVALQETITNLATFLSEAGTLRAAFSTVYETLTEGAREYDADLAEQFPTPTALSASFDSLEKEVMDLAERFNPEQCQRLAKYYATLSCELDALAKGLEEIDDGPELVKELTAIVQQTIRGQLPTAQQTVEAYFTSFDAESYCAAFAFCPLLKAFLNELQQTNQKRNWIASDVPTFTASDPCEMLDEAHERFRGALASVRDALMEKADRIQTFGQAQKWTNEDLAQISNLVEAITELGQDLATIREALVKDEHALCSNCVAQNDKQNSETFLTALIDAEMDLMNAELLYLRDVLNRILYEQAFESAWLRILHGVTRLAETIEEDAPPLDRVQTITDVLSSQVTELTPLLATYLEAPQPNDAHLNASTALANALAPDFEPVLPPLSFTQVSWQKDVTATLEQVERMTPAVAQTREALAQSTFFKQPALEQSLSEFVPRLKEFAALCTQAPQSVSSPLLLEERMRDRTRLQCALMSVAEQAERLLETLKTHTAEHALRRSVAATQAVFDVLPSVGNLFRQVIEGAPATSVQAELSAIYAQLKQAQPKATSPPAPMLADSLIAVQKAWAQGPTAEALVAATDQVHTAAFETLVELLRCVGELPPIEDSPLEADPTAVNVSLTEIEQAFDGLRLTLERTARFMADLRFDPEVVMPLIDESSPLQKLCILASPFNALAQTLIEEPGVLYEEVGEDALILQKIAGVFSPINALLQNLRDLIDRQAAVERLRPSYRLLLQFRALVKQADAVVAQPNLSDVIPLFDALVILAPEFTETAAPEDLIKTLQRVAEALECLGSPAVAPEPEKDIILNSLTQEAIDALIEDAVNTLQCAPQTWESVWLMEPYTLKEGLIQNVLSVQRALEQTTYNWTTLGAALQSFAEQLMRPTCCVGMNEVLVQIYDHLIALTSPLEGLSNLAFLPVLETRPYSSLCNDITTLTNILHETAAHLSALIPEPACQNAAFMEMLTNINGDLTAFQTTLSTLANRLGNVPKTRATPPLPDIAPCHLSDVLLARFAPELDEALSYGNAFLNIVVLREGESRPYRSDLIAELTTFIAALDELAGALGGLAWKVPCPEHDPLDGVRIAIANSLGTIKQFVEDLIDHLDTFKYAQIGQLIHDLEAQAAATKHFVEALKTLDLPNDSTLFGFLKSAVESITSEWNRELSKIPTASSELVGNETTFKNLLSGSQELATRLQQLTGEEAPEARLVAYGEKQIAEDLALIREHQTDFKALIAEIHAAWTTPPRKNHINAAAVTDAFTSFYELLQNARQTLTADPMTPFKEALAHFLPPEEEPEASLLLHQLAFSLRNETCCETYRDLLAEIVTEYQTAEKALDGLVAGEAEPPLTVEAALDQIRTSLDALTTSLTDGIARTNRITAYVNSVSTTTCFTAEGPSPVNTKAGTDTKRDMTALVANLKAASVSINNLCAARQSLYAQDSTGGFAAFPDAVASTLPYYQDDIAQKWSEVNAALAAQISAYSDVKKALIDKQICFLLDANNEYATQLEPLDTMQALLTTSQAAWTHYQARCCARATESLRRIVNRLSPLTAISELLFQNATIDDAETCCQTLAEALSAGAEEVAKLRILDPHTRTTQQQLEAVESQLASLEPALAAYGHGIVVPSGDSSASTEETTFEDQLAALRQMIETQLTATLTRWTAALEAQNGESTNERCYSEAATPFIALLGHLKEIFENQTIGSFYAETHAPAPAVSSLAAIAQAFGTLKIQAEAIDALLKFPTCCIQRAHVFYALHMQLDLAARCLEGALEHFDGTLDAATFKAAIEATTTTLQAVTADLGAIEYGSEDLRCKAIYIVARTTPLLTDVTAFTTQLRSALAPLGTPKAAGTGLIFKEDQSGCDRLEVLDEEVSAVFKRIANSLNTFAKAIPDLPLQYNAGVMDVLKGLLEELSHAKSGLDAFRTSLEAPCSSCHTETELYPLEPILDAFVVVLQAIEANRDTGLARMFHSMTEAARVCTEHFETLLKVKAEGLSLNDLREIQEGFAVLVAPLQQAVQALKDAADFDVEAPETYAIYSTITTKLQAIDRDLQITLTALRQPTEVTTRTPPDVFGLDSMEADWTTLEATLERMAAAFTQQASAPALYHRALEETWTEVGEALGTLKEALEARTGFVDWLTTEALSDKAEKIVSSEQSFLEAIQKMDPCSKLNAPLKQLLPILKAMTQTFLKAPTVFQVNIADGLPFQQMLGTLTASARTLKTALTTPPTDEGADDPLVIEKLICHFNAAHLERITDACVSLKDATLEFARVFLPDLADDAYAPSEKTTRSDIYQEIVNELGSLETALSGTIAQAKLCPVRDYRAVSVDALETFWTALSELIDAVPESFALVHVCNYCDEEAEQNILKGMMPACHRLPEDIQEGITYLKQTCCSRLAFQFFELADHLSLLQQYVDERSKGDRKALEDFFKQLARTVPELSETIVTQNLGAFRSLFTGSKDCLAPTALAFILKWDQQVITPLLDVARTSTKRASTVLHPNVYDCSTLPSAMKASLDLVPLFVNSFAAQISLLDDATFSYQEMYPLGVFFETFREILAALISLGDEDSPLRNATFCPYCGELTVYAEALVEATPPLKGIQSAFTELHAVLEKYCDYEIIALLHRYNTDMEKVIRALETVNEETFSEKWKTFTNQGQRTLNNLYIAENASNTTLESLITAASTATETPPHCLLRTFIPDVEALQGGMEQVAKNLIPLVGETFSPAYDSLPYGQSSVIEQGHLYLTNLSRINALLQGILDQAVAAQLQLSDEIISAFIQLYGVLLTKADRFKALDAVWATKLPCPKWGPCDNCSACDACADNAAEPHISCHVLYHISFAMQDLAIVVNDFGNSFIETCCQLPFQFLFPIAQGIGDIGTCLEGIEQTLRTAASNTDFALPADLLVGALRIFAEGMEQTKVASEHLVEAHEKAHAEPGKSCRMAHMTDAFKGMCSVFKIAEEGGEETGLVPELLHFLTAESVTIPPLQEADKFAFMCNELEVTLSLMLQNIQNASYMFTRISEAYSAVKKKLTAPDADEMKQLHDTVLDIAARLLGLQLTQGQTPLCINCPNSVLQESLPKLSEALTELAKSLLLFRATTLLGNCCPEFGHVLEYTQNLLVSAFTNVGTGLGKEEMGPAIIAQGDFLTTALQKTLQALAHLLSSRQTLALPTTARPCVSEDWVPDLRTLNNVWEKVLPPTVASLLKPLGLEVSIDPNPSQEDETCDAIVRNFMVVPAAVKAFNVQLSKAPRREGIGIGEATILADRLRTFSDLFIQAKALVNELAVAERSKAICPTCDFQEALTALVAQLEETALLLNMRADELDQTEERLTISLKASILDATTRLAHWLKEVSNLQTLSPHIATLEHPVAPDTAPFSEITGAGAEGVAHILDALMHLPDHLGDARLEDLERIRSALEKAEKTTETFLKHTVDAETWKAIKATLPPSTSLGLETGATEFPKILSNRLDSITESILAMAESCLYEKIQTDDPVELGNVEALAEQTRSLANGFKEHPTLSTATAQLALAAETLARNLRPDGTQFGTTLSGASDLIRQIAAALNRSRPALPSWDRAAYVEAWNTFFQTLTSLAEWSVRLERTKAETQDEFDEAIKEVFEAAPFEAILDAALQLEQASTGTTNPQPTNVFHGEALCEFADACAFFKEALMNFALAAQTFHIEQKLMVDLQGPLNLLTLLPLLQNTWKTLQRQAVVQQMVSESERAVLSTVLEQLAEAASPIATLLQTTQKTVQTTLLREHLDALTLDEQGVPVVQSLFQADHDTLGVPRLDTHGNAYAAPESLLAQTYVTAHHCEVLNKQTLGIPLCPNFKKPA